MRNIYRLKARGLLTEMQTLTALRFYKNPNAFNLSPTIFRVLREIIIDERPLEELEQARGWTARSAKTILALLLSSIEEAEGVFWSEVNGNLNTEIEEYLNDRDGEEISELGERYKLSAKEARLLAILNRCFGKPVPHESISAQLYPNPDSVQDPLRVIRVLITNIRKKIAGHDLQIRAVHGIGLVLEDTKGPIDEEMKRIWEKERSTGLTYQQIADKYGRHRSTIWNVLARSASDPRHAPGA